MSDRAPQQTPAESDRAVGGRTAGWLAAALVLAVLAACEHGQLSYDRSTGQFRVPIGAGSHGQGPHR
jgi:hypothetical protein